MGKGRIVSSQGEGLYTIEILEDRARAITARALAVERIDSIDERLGDLEDEVDAAQVKVNQAITAQDEAIDQYREDIETTGSSEVDLTEFARKVLEAATERDTIRAQSGPLRAERLALETRIRRIDALPPLRQIAAWCADYTDDLAGEVATAEVPGEVGHVLVRPGYDGDETAQWPDSLQGGAAWSATRDGAMQPALSSTPAGVFYNLALMPGWQKWRPTFRIATITSIDNDLCDIVLDSATSSQQGLGVNAQASFAEVPIYYMDCNGEPFDEGDRVLVAFSGNTQKPMVVGFEREPRPCCFCAVSSVATQTLLFFDGFHPWFVADAHEGQAVERACPGRSLWAIVDRFSGRPITHGALMDYEEDDELISPGVIDGLPARIDGHDNTVGDTLMVTTGSLTGLRYNEVLKRDVYGEQFGPGVHVSWDLSEFATATHPDHSGMNWGIGVNWGEEATNNTGAGPLLRGYVDDDGNFVGLPSIVSPEDPVLELVLVVYDELLGARLGIACLDPELSTDEEEVYVGAGAVSHPPYQIKVPIPPE